MSDLERLYTLADVARHLGVSVQTIKRFIRVGRLRAVRFGRTPRVTEEELRRFLKEGTEPAKPPAAVSKGPAGVGQSELDRRMIYERMLDISAPKRAGKKPRGDT